METCTCPLCHRSCCCGGKSPPSRVRQTPHTLQSPPPGWTQPLQARPILWAGSPLWPRIPWSPSGQGTPPPILTWPDHMIGITWSSDDALGLYADSAYTCVYWTQNTNNIALQVLQRCWFLLVTQSSCIVKFWHCAFWCSNVSNLFRSQVVREAKFQVEPPHHHERDQPLLLGWYCQHRNEEQSSRGKKCHQIFIRTVHFHIVLTVGSNWDWHTGEHHLRIEVFFEACVGISRKAFTWGQVSFLPFVLPGDHQVWGEALCDTVSGRWVSVPRCVRVPPGARGYLQAVRKRTQAAAQQNDGTFLQVRHLFISKYFALQLREERQQQKEIEWQLHIWIVCVLSFSRTNALQQTTPLLSCHFVVYCRYNSGGKSFSEITSTKHISVSIDAVTIQNHFWQKKNPPAKKPHQPMY